MRALHDSTRRTLEVTSVFVLPLAFGTLLCGGPIAGAVLLGVVVDQAIDGAVTAEARRQGCRAQRWSATRPAAGLAYVTVDLACPTGRRVGVDWVLRRERTGHWRAR